MQKCTGEHFLDWIQNKQTWQISQSLNEVEAKHDVTVLQGSIIWLSPLSCMLTPPIHHQEIVVDFLFTDRCFKMINEQLIN